MNKPHRKGEICRTLKCRYHGAIWQALAAKGWITLRVDGQWALMGQVQD